LLPAIELFRRKIKILTVGIWAISPLGEADSWHHSKQSSE